MKVRSRRICHGRVESSALWLIKNECKRITDDLELSDGWRSRTSLNLFVAELEVSFHNEKEFELKHFDNPRLAKAPLCRRAFGSRGPLVNIEGRVCHRNKQSQGLLRIFRRQDAGVKPAPPNLPKTLAAFAESLLCVFRALRPPKCIDRPTAAGRSLRPWASRLSRRIRGAEIGSSTTLSSRATPLTSRHQGRAEPYKEISAHGANRPTFTFTRNFHFLLTSTCRTTHPAMA